jgi:hypothetical protein
MIQYCLHTNGFTMAKCCFIGFSEPGRRTDQVTATLLWILIYALLRGWGTGWLVLELKGTIMRGDIVESLAGDAELLGGCETAGGCARALP